VEVVFGAGRHARRRHQVAVEALGQAAGGLHDEAGYVERTHDPRLEIRESRRAVMERHSIHHARRQPPHVEEVSADEGVIDAEDLVFDLV
jgi:hypothetical protein